MNERRSQPTASALAPQSPAPVAGAVEALDALFRENAIEMTDRNGELYDALAARTAPAVAEKVPLTVEEIGDLLQDHARYSDEMQDFAREVQSAFAKKNGLRLAGSAQEGQANG